jgi:hypothetical protein
MPPLAAGNVDMGLPTDHLRVQRVYGRLAPAVVPGSCVSNLP